MSLLEKTNPHATRRSVLRNAIQGAMTVPLFIFIIGKPYVREHYRITISSPMDFQYLFSFSKKTVRVLALIRSW